MVSTMGKLRGVKPALLPRHAKKAGTFGGPKANPKHPQHGHKNSIVNKPDGTMLYHGSGARLRPGEKLKPGNQDGAQPKGVYATSSKRVGNTSAVYNQAKGYRYNIKKQKSHEWHTPDHSDPRIKQSNPKNPSGQRNPTLEVASKHKVKPHSVTQVKFNTRFHQQRTSNALLNGQTPRDKMQMTDGLPHYHGRAMKTGHTYLHTRRTINGKPSNLMHDNLPTHTSAQGQTKMPHGTTIHSMKGRGSRKKPVG